MDNNPTNPDNRADVPAVDKPRPATESDQDVQPSAPPAQSNDQSKRTAFSSTIEAPKHEVKKVITPTTASPKKPAWKAMLPVVILLAIVLLGSGVFAAMTLLSNKPDPSQLFAEFPRKAMDVSSVEWDMSVEASIFDLRGQAQIDYSDAAAVKLRSTTTTEIQFFVEARTEQQYIDDGNEQFIRLNDISIESSEALEGVDSSLERLTPLLGRWINTSDDSLPDDVQAELTEFDGGYTSALATVLGEIVFYDFNEAQQSQLLEQLAAEPVYSYSGQPAEDIIDGEPTYRYEVTVNREHLRAFNQKVIEMLGLNEVLPPLSTQERLTLWLSQDSGLPKRLAMEDSQSLNAGQATLTYKNYNQQFNITAPDDVLPSSEVIEILEGQQTSD